MPSTVDLSYRTTGTDYALIVLLVALVGWCPRRGWLHWRYGLLGKPAAYRTSFPCKR